MSSASKQPTLFEVFGRSQSPIVPEINEEALNRLTDVLTSSGDEAGKVVLLRSPRAGYGKTLLLQAAYNRLNESFRFLAVEPSGGGRLDGEVVLESVLRQLSEVLPASGGLTEFDLFARRLFALGLKPLLISGEIPSHDREGALFAIENRPIETFDFHHQQAATAHWTQANFEVLGPRLASELSELSGCGLRGCAYWVDLLFRYATTSPEKVERSRLLSDCVFGELAGQAKSGAEEQLQSLLSLLSVIEPVVLVFDETEGLSNQPDAGLRVAAFVVQLRQACPALTVILSVNEDVWLTGLSPLMPGGLEDRLTEFEVHLGELSRSEAESLLSSRFGRDFETISQKMDWPEPLSARAVLRQGTQTARTLVIEEPASEEPFALTGASAGIAMPPPLEEVSQAFGQKAFSEKAFSEKAERVLEPTSSFEAEPEVGFEAPSQVQVELEERVEPVSDSQEPESFAEEASGPVIPADEPFTEAPVTPPKDFTEVEVPDGKESSPFEIAPEEVTPSLEIVTPEEKVESGQSPFSQVDEGSTVAVASSEGKWSAQSAVDHFAATQEVSSPEAKSAPEHSEEESSSAPSTGSVFDEAPAAKAVPEATESSPFRQMEEDKTRIQAEAREKELLAARMKQESEQQAADLVESSPFSVSEPVKELQPESAAEAVSVSPASQPVQEQAANPFSIKQPEAEPKQVAPVTDSVSAETISRETSPVSAKAPTPVQEETAPVTQSAPKTAEPAAPSESPFAAASNDAPTSSSFASAAPTTSGEDAAPAKSPEAEDVEALLNQFKKRFGQSGS